MDLFEVVVSPGSGQGSGLKLEGQERGAESARSPLAPVRGAD